VTSESGIQGAHRTGSLTGMLLWAVPGLLVVALAALSRRRPLIAFSIPLALLVNLALWGAAIDPLGSLPCLASVGFWALLTLFLVGMRAGCRSDRPGEYRAVIEAFGLLGVLLVAIIFITLFEIHLEARSELFAALILYGVVLVLWTGSGYRFSGGCPDVFRGRRVVTTILLGLAGAAVLLVIVFQYLDLVRSLQPEEIRRRLEEIPLSEASPIIQVLAICILPGIFEEVAFRGLAYNAVQRVLGRGNAIVLSSVFFAAVHYGLPSFPPVLLFGLWVAFLRARSGALLPGMVVHAAWNFTVLWMDWTGVESPLDLVTTIP
jgi:membrane protease YdiL (CAAX protease family)